MYSCLEMFASSPLGPNHASFIVISPHMLECVWPGCGLGPRSRTLRMLGPRSRTLRMLGPRSRTLRMLAWATITNASHAVATITNASHAWATITDASRAWAKITKRFVCLGHDHGRFVLSPSRALSCTLHGTAIATFCIKLRSCMV